MKIKLNNILSVVALALMILLLPACDEPAPEKRKPTVKVIAKKISQPASASKAKPSNPVEKAKAAPPAAEKVPPEQKEIKPSETVKEEFVSEIVTEHYDSKGKIDPFIPLIQEKSDAAPAQEAKRPKRILTPLEKIELSQIKLVAVIWMKDRRIAMVEEANGKGYEIGIGTYIGRNQGRVAEIKENSIIVKELAKDFKGRYRERIQEIKLHTNDREE